MRPTQARSPDDEEQLESFEDPRSGRLIEKLLGVLSGVMLAALVLSLVGQITGQHLLSQIFAGRPLGGPAQTTNESFTPARLPAATETPIVTEARPASTETPPAARPNRESLLAGGPARVKSVSPRDTDRLAPTRREMSGPAEVTGTASRELSITSRKTSPPPKETTPRAELVRGPESRGSGASYAVRLLDSTGKPMVMVDVLLVAEMADGTVKQVAMGALPERGIYRGTVATGRSTPVNLRVRLRTGDKFIEVPVRP